MIADDWAWAPSSSSPTFAKHFRDGKHLALIGVLQRNSMHRLSNSVIGLSGDEIYRYDKRHLVPFGESIPPGVQWLVQRMRLALSDFTRGVDIAEAFVVRGERVLPHVCFEIMFGEELAESFRDAATAPTILAHLGNMVWFGRTIALDQELNASRMRSLEFQRPMIRADNVGVTAIIDRFGRVAAQIQPYTSAVLEGDVQGSVGLTPYARWASALGHWPLWVLALFPLVLSVAKRRSGGLCGFRTSPRP